MSDELAKLKARYERLNALYQVGSVIQSTLEPQEALQLIVNQAVRQMRASSGSVVLINPTNGLLEIHASEGLPAKAAELKLRVGEGITGWVARTGKPARVGDVTRDPRYVLLRRQVRSELAVPLEVGGEVRGVLNVDSDRLDAFSAEDQELLEALAAQAARVIHNTWLYEQLRLKARLFESLASVSQTINTSLNLDDVLRVITRAGVRADAGEDVFVDAAGRTTASGWSCGPASGRARRYVNRPRLTVEESLLGIVVRRKKPMQVENVQVSSRYQSVEVARREGLVALLSVPLLYGGAGHRHAQRLYRPALQFSRTRRFASCRRWRSCRPSPSRRRAFTSGWWMWKSSCARTRSSRRWACWRRRWRMKFATR